MTNELNNQSHIKINTYPEMNKKIVEYLRIGESQVDMYAAARIEELEEQLKQAVGLLKWFRDRVARDGSYVSTTEYGEACAIIRDHSSSLSQGTEDEPMEKSSREKLRYYGFEKELLEQWTDQECDENLEAVEMYPEG